LFQPNEQTLTNY